MKCENCGNEHNGSYGSGRFCSEHCRRSFCGKKRTHFPTKDELKTRNGFMKQRKIGGWQCKECDIWFDTRRELEEHRHLVHPIPKGQPWNKGLTKKSRTGRLLVLVNTILAIGNVVIVGWCSTLTN